MATTDARREHTERAAMLRAVRLAARGLGLTSPNPVVGCVVLDRHGTPVGEGWHQRAGGPHAEVHALREAGDRARGGVAVVTLEPCSHTGRTGPCVDALLAAGIARVVYAVDDPTPAGSGARALAAAGVEVVGGVLTAEATATNVAWLTAMRRGRPHVRWKYAATLDGRVAAADATSRWITSAESRADVHRLRAEADAVLVGSGTARIDDPQLAVRPPEAGREAPTVPEPEAPPRQPLRVVVDSEATAVRPGARVLDDSAPTLIAVAEDVDRTALEGLATLLPLPRAAGGRGLDIPALLAALHARGVRSVLLEGGPTLAGAFVAAHAVDQVVGYLAPALLGAGPAVLDDAGIATLADIRRLTVTDVTRLGPDLRITAELPAPSLTAHAAPTEES